MCLLSKKRLNHGMNHITKIKTIHNLLCGFSVTFVTPYKFNISDSHFQYVFLLYNLLIANVMYSSTKVLFMIINMPCYCLVFVKLKVYVYFRRRKFSICNNAILNAEHVLFLLHKTMSKITKY